MTAPAPTSPPVELFEQLRAHYDAGRYLTAWRGLCAAGGLQAAVTPEQRLLTARITGQIGNGRRARLEYLRVFRTAPGDPDAQLYYAMTVLNHTGPLAALAVLDRLGEHAAATPLQRADLILTRANALGALRDFAAAERYQREAEALAPDHPWLWVQWAQLRMRQDALDEAAGALRRALALHPMYRPAVQHLGHLLQLQGRDDEALSVLQEAAPRLECMGLHTQLGALLQELGDPSGALAAYWRAAELSPWMDSDTFEWFASTLGLASYRAGELSRAVELFQLHPEKKLHEVAERVAATSTVRRVLLPVPFVQQHHLTCAPATLTSIARLWEMPAEHVSVSEAICYDGTPAHSERRWAQENGWVAREFTVDWDTTVALIDRGIAFTLTTTAPSSAHLQAVAGYDPCLRTLLLRDPSSRFVLHADADALFEYEAAHGPRGMAMVPAHAQARLLEVPLPDAALYDELYALQLALQAHDREGAGQIAGRMRSAWPEHRLTAHAALALAGYDQDARTRRDQLAQLQERYPKDARLQLLRFTSSANLELREERLARLGVATATKDAHPELLLAHASELAEDARARPMAERLLRRGLRRNPVAPRGLSALARLRWSQGRRAEALQLHRFSACLSDRDEDAALTYFNAAHAVGAVEDALSFLDHRFQRFGHKAAGPGVTLVHALERLDRGQDAEVVLATALRQRPEDGELMLTAMGSRLAAGHPEQAEALLERAKGKVRQLDWLRACARWKTAIADANGELACWREVLELDPLEVDAHVRLCVLLARDGGPAAAIDHLRAILERFPHHIGLHSLLLEWTRSHDRGTAEQTARKMIALHPGDGWARRELVLALAHQRRFDEARAALNDAWGTEPDVAPYFNVAAALSELSGDLPSAREHLRRSLQADPDQPYALRQLFSALRSTAERIEALEFVSGLLERRPLASGDGILELAELAVGLEPPEALVARWARQAAAHPGLYPAQTAHVRALLTQRALKEALAAARRVVAQFPLIPGAWLELANVQKEKGDTVEAERALQTAVRLNPSWGNAAVALTQLYVRRGALGQAEEVLTRCVRACPDDGAVRSELARLLWNADRRVDAIDELERALRVDPSSGGWGALQRWCREAAVEDRSESLARTLTRERPLSPHPWMALAQLLEPSRVEEALAALDEAEQRAPRWSDVYDYRASLLAQAGRYDEAARACRPAIYGDSPPCELKGRAAWIRSVRGELEGAIQDMLAVIEIERDYAWGIQQLTDWISRLEPDAAMPLAERLIALIPTRAEAYGCKGETLRRGGWREPAQGAFEKALELDPTYGFAALSLAELAMGRRDWLHAEAMLNRAEPHVDPAAVLARRAHLAAKTWAKGTVATSLRALLALDPDEHTWRLAVRGAREEGLAKLEEQALEMETVRAQRESLGARWGEHLAATGTTLGAWRRLRALREQVPIMGLRATATYLEQLCERGAALTLRLFLWWHGPRLLATAVVFGAVTYALTHRGLYGLLLRVTRGYRSVEGFEPWMGFNMVVAARARGRRALAAEVAEAALQRPQDQYSAVVALWLANEHALAGRREQARALLTDPAGLPELAGVIHAVTTALLDEGAPREKLEALWPKIRPQLNDPPRRRLFFDAAREVARREGTFAGWCWWLWKTLLLPF